MQVEIKDGNLVISIPVNNPMPLSKTGKSKLVASTGGNLVTAIQIDGKPVKIGLNAFVDAQ
jgi:hypothetical protein